MKYLVLILLAVSLSFGCKRKHSDPTTENTNESFDLSGSVNRNLDSIQCISQLVVNNPESQQDHDINDSITRKISVYTENIIGSLIESHGKTPTDTILAVLKRLDNSGYIPIGLYKKLSQEELSTEIGKTANKAYQKYLAAKEEEEGNLKSIDLLDKKLVLNSINDKDIIVLGDLLSSHNGYKVLDFWASWCAPCRSFNKRFQSHYQEYQDLGIEFYGIGIRIDSENERDKFLTAIKKDKTPWKQFIDPDNAIYNLFETNKVPYQVLLNERNEVIKILSHDIQNELDEVLKR